MATNLTLLPLPASARNLRTGASRSGSSWWSPIFGWSTEPEYIDSGAAKARFAPGCFTEEKAKRLRMMTKETESFHDVMYHSAIASRLALDSNGRSDP